MRFKTFAAAALMAAAGLLVAETTASAAWVCTSKNKTGRTWAAVGDIKQNVKDRALLKCQLESLPRNKASCYIASCTS